MAWVRALTALSRVILSWRSISTVPLAVLGGAGGAGQHGPGGVLGVDRVGLAALTPDPPVGAVDLQDAMAAAAQVAGQPGTVGPGALYPEGDDLALGVGPLGELGVAAGIGGHG
jgi:hypothetical protein